MDAGDVVIVRFPGAVATKRRPAVVLSTDLYHAARPDIIVGLVTTKLAGARQPTDCILQDWQQAGLRSASAFRAYLFTTTQVQATRIGRLSDGDWKNVRECLNRSIAI